MKKEIYPIIEHDDALESIINPSYIQKKHPSIPSKLIISFFHEVIDALHERQEITKVITVKGENSYDIFVSRDAKVAYIKGLVGAPACGAQLEECIALGAKTVVFAGGGGVLDSAHTVGKLIVVDSAIRDEGMSYHYVKPSREIQADSFMVNHISVCLNSSGADYLVGKTWTTDALFRETKARVLARKNEGAVIVEMEQAALIAIASFRNIRYGAIVYCGDDVSKDHHDTRSWRSKSEVRTALVDLCKSILLAI